MLASDSYFGAQALTVVIPLGTFIVWLIVAFFRRHPHV
jgi:hypothetical protein